MFIAIQFPFIDLRLLDNKVEREHKMALEKRKKGERAEKPFFFPSLFKNKKSDKDRKTYYRYFGFKGGRRKTLSLPHSEKSFFGHQSIFSIRPNGGYKVLYTRLFTDDIFFHFDIGIKVDAPDTNEIIDLYPIIVNLFETDIFLPIKDYPIKKEYSMYSLQEYIEKQYIYSTTHINALKGTDHTDIVRFGKAALFCQYTHGKYFYSKDAADIDVGRLGVDGIHMQITEIGDGSPLWLISKPDSDGVVSDKLRDLRICLLKLNNYREGLDQLLHHLPHTSFDSLSGLAVQNLSYVKELIERDTLNSIPGKEIMDMAISSERLVFYESWDAYTTKLKTYLERMKKKEEAGKMGDTHNYYGNVGAVFSGEYAGQYAQITQSCALPDEATKNKGYADVSAEIEVMLKYFREAYAKADEAGDKKATDGIEIVQGTVIALKNAGDAGDAVTAIKEGKEDNTKFTAKLKEIGKELGGNILTFATELGCKVLAELIHKQLGGMP